MPDAPADPLDRVRLIDGRGRVVPRRGPGPGAVASPFAKAREHLAVGPGAPARSFDAVFPPLAAGAIDAADAS